MRQDFDPNWPHGHVTRNGLRYYGRLVGADGSSAGWIEGLLGHELAEHDENGLYLNRHPKWTREDHPYDLVNAPAPKPTPTFPTDETAALKARIAELEAQVAALTPLPDEGTLWVLLARRHTTGKPYAVVWGQKPDADEVDSGAISLIRVPWKAGQFDE